MALIEHPVFPDQRKEVDDDAVEAWVAGGWVTVNKDGSSPSPDSPKRRPPAPPPAPSTPVDDLTTRGE